MLALPASASRTQGSALTPAIEAGSLAAMTWPPASRTAMAPNSGKAGTATFTSCLASAGFMVGGITAARPARSPLRSASQRSKRSTVEVARPSNRARETCSRLCSALLVTRTTTSVVTGRDTASSPITNLTRKRREVDCQTEATACTPSYRDPVVRARLALDLGRKDRQL